MFYGVSLEWFASPFSRLAFCFYCFVLLLTYLLLSDVRLGLLRALPLNSPDSHPSKYQAVHASLAMPGRPLYITFKLVTYLLNGHLSKQ